ncbi:D-alanyl-glycyl endopeptidase-like protein [Trypanosoma rangeli]|uniref:D-alanyl-glycyl endopeptidase-like protein n=1 Tax=Trypanosoma rangeli TaxID=5698 RepID=A0A422NKH5_TRYRA|nr:D-alanyl-glycyl endopeptidase-like protein [Trypanosoma rangeli]RNF05924.1 D-alanyl-glycyl endopeptidase-like protein [Trypanosoma rangeli]|eukprot:RNF05924.1 D-alanyl-glycyl endopeptidase-like protein [Trypanosoma rangeli]
MRAVEVSPPATASKEAAAASTERTPLLKFHPRPIEVGSMQQQEEMDEMSFWERVSSPLHPVLNKVQEHCHYEWVAALLSAIMLVALFVIVFYLDTPPRPVHCVTPFGELLGESNGVLAFSNCNRDYRDVEEHFVLVKTSQVHSGLKWRSVEYARRFWLLAKQPAVQFMSVTCAEDIWTRVDYAYYINGKRVKLLKYENMMACDQAPLSKTTMKKGQWKHYGPQIGDLLVYANDSRLPGGHVAVVVGRVSQPPHAVSNTSWIRQCSLLLAEQNWDNARWLYNETLRGRDTPTSTAVPLHYSRKVLLQEVDSTRKMCVKDPRGTVLGWVRV